MSLLSPLSSPSPGPSLPPTGIILFGHGSRDPLWRQAMDAVAACIVRQQPGTPVVCAFLELSRPSLADAAADMVAGGATHLRVFPLFLGVGKHAREDLPLLMAQIQATHPHVTLDLLPAAGEHPLLIALLADIAQARPSIATDLSALSAKTKGNNALN